MIEDVAGIDANVEAPPLDDGVPVHPRYPAVAREDERPAIGGLNRSRAHRRPLPDISAENRVGTSDCAAEKRNDNGGCASDG